jgi:hypothetical protein
LLHQQDCLYKNNWATGWDIEAMWDLWVAKSWKFSNEWQSTTNESCSFKIRLWQVVHNWFTETDYHLTVIASWIGNPIKEDGNGRSVLCLIGKHQHSLAKGYQVG